jgi:CHAD domain-containing protein
MRTPPPRPEFALEPTQAVDLALRKIASGQVRHALRLLRDPHLDAHVAIHEARRALRRLRALVLLLRPRLGEHYAEVVAPLRDAGRLLSPLRDRQSVHEAVDALEHAARDPLNVGTAALVRQRLGHAQRRGRARASAVMARAVERIKDARPNLVRALAGTTREDLLAGLRLSMRRARSAMRAADAQADEAALHCWRRRVRALWLQWELLTPVWPRGLTGMVNEYKRVSRRLGLERDLALLTQRMATWRAPLGELSIDALQQRIASRRAALRVGAGRASALLLAESPKAVVQRMARYWRLVAGSSTPMDAHVASGA